MMLTFSVCVHHYRLRESDLEPLRAALKKLEKKCRKLLTVRKELLASSASASSSSSLSSAAAVDPHPHGQQQSAPESEPQPRSEGAGAGAEGGPGSGPGGAAETLDLMR